MWRQGSSCGTGMVARPTAAPSSELGGEHRDLVEEQAWIPKTAFSRPSFQERTLCFVALRGKTQLINSYSGVLRLLPL